MTHRRGLGLLCHRCGEPFTPSEYGYVSDCLEADGWTCIAFHRECRLRMVIGSAGHLLRQCSCYGGDLEDPPNLSIREAAQAAVAIWEGRRRAQDHD
jgi:hypothetical protein